MNKPDNNLYFVCDPELNTECPKTNCAHRVAFPGKCMHTHNKAFAKMPIETVRFVIPMEESDAQLLIDAAEREKKGMN